MSSSLILSAMTVVAITAATLTTLKYYPKHGDDVDEFNSYDDNDVDYDFSHFHKHVKATSDRPHGIVKRSSEEEGIVQYSIDDFRNSSMIDEAKREKVKEVLTTMMSFIHMPSVLLLLL